MAASGESVTFAELDARSNQGAQLFRKLGLKTGDGIAIFMENNIRFLEICWAAQRAGLYFTAVSSRLTAGEVEYIVKDANAKVLIAGHTLAKVAGEVAPLIPGVNLLMVGGTIPGLRLLRRRNREDAGRRRSQTRSPARRCSIRRARPDGRRACASRCPACRSMRRRRCSVW